MLFSQAMILHSQTSAGRHLLTTLNIPPMLIGPVAANHCRAGVFLLRLVSHKVSSLDGPPGEVLVLSRDDVPDSTVSPATYPEVDEPVTNTTIGLRMMSGPKDLGEDLDDFDDDTEFLTILPPSDWSGTYDGWIVQVARHLGLDIAPAQPAEAYHAQFTDAVREVQGRVPDIRSRFRAGLDGLILALKVGLPTTAGGTEFVWLSVLEWPDDETATCRLESSPVDCPGYTLGQTMPVAVVDIVDFMIGGAEAGGVVDPGLTQRLAEDYGLTIAE
jgi:hypothetical protein